VARLEAVLSLEAAELHTLRAHVADVEMRLTQCERGGGAMGGVGGGGAMGGVGGGGAMGGVAGVAGAPSADAHAASARSSAGRATDGARVPHGAEGGHDALDDPGAGADDVYLPNEARGGGVDRRGDAGAADAADDASASEVGGTGAADAHEPPPARLCWLVLLERPGGLDVAVHSARAQVGVGAAAFRMVVLDRLHASRGASLQKLLRHKLSRGIARHVTHLPAPPADDGRGWRLRGVWEHARAVCEAGGALQTVVLSRQFVWVPPSFVSATMHFHAAAAAAAARRSGGGGGGGGGGRAVLGYPLWQFRAPSAEIESEAMDDDASVGVFSPPLTCAFSSRGWRMARRVPPAAVAALAGADATRLADGGARAVLAGLGAIWSAPASVVPSMGEALLPAASGGEGERCLDERAKGAPRGQLLPPGVAPMLANLSLLCEVLDTSGWEPTSRWQYEPHGDGGCAR
jgi:hypothetical protein